MSGNTTRVIATRMIDSLVNYPYLFMGLIGMKIIVSSARLAD
jgi:hypothetical protein